MLKYLLLSLFVFEYAFSEVSYQFIVATVSMEKLLNNSLAGKSIREQLEDINNKEKTDLIDLESKIKEMDSKKNDDEDIRKIENLQVILYDMTRKKRYQIQEAYQIALKKFEQKVQEIIKEIAVEKNIFIVLPDDIAIYRSDNCKDITNDVLLRLDSSMQEVKVVLEKSKE